MKPLHEHGICKNCKQPIIITPKQWALHKPYCSHACKINYRKQLWKEANTHENTKP